MAPQRSAAFAPGRVNLIGEHTDYNDGLCLPFAIERGVTCSVERTSGEDVLAPWDDGGLVQGIVAELRQAGVGVPGCRLELASDLPRGAGLSSSAALAVSISLALCAAAAAEPPDPVALARLCSRVERERLGAETGLLDQLASLLGEPGHALRLDMRTLALGASRGRGPRRSDAIRPVPLRLGHHALVTLDSGAPRSLARSGYNERRAECRQAAQQLGAESLRDATFDAAAELPAPLDRRVRHVVAENGRVDAAVEALARADMAALGELLDASHASLRDNYEVSVLEVEHAVRACKEAGALGARIMGGGFGGSVLALFPPGARPPARAVAVRPGRGARRV